MQRGTIWLLRKYCHNQRLFIFKKHPLFSTMPNHTNDMCELTNTSICVFMLASPVGDYELHTCSHGIHSLQHISERVEESDLKPNIRTEVRIKKGDRKNRVASETAEWLQKYFYKDVKGLKLPAICHLCDIDNDSAFVPQVWKSLAEKVGFGSKLSYGELAVLTGYRSNAARAVGTAMRTNPVSILVPCHRVVKADGSMGNYSSGYKNGLKSWLLQHEGAL